jgi:hypothetical protein
MAGFNLPFGPFDPNSLPARLRQPPGLIPGPIQPVQLKPGFNPPSLPGMTPMAASPEPGLNVKEGAAVIKDALEWIYKLREADPGVVAQRAADAANASVQANPATSIAGMKAGTNPDAFIAGGMPVPPIDTLGLLKRPDFFDGRQWPNPSWENFRG